MDHDSYLPNNNADIYRNLALKDSLPVYDQHLQFIAIRKDNVLLGASNMTDRYWTGTVWYFNDTTKFDRKSGSSLKTECGLTDGDFLDDDNVVIAEDSGVLQILSIKQDGKSEISNFKCACQHDDSITCLAVFNRTHLVTGGMDCCIKIWETSVLMAEHTFITAHTDTITGLDIEPQSASVFVSTSLDCEATVWDIRLQNTATAIYRKEDCGLTAVAWNPSDKNMIAIGAEDGSVTLVDLRNPNEALCETISFPRQVHKLKFHPNEKSWLAGCCLNTVVKVLNSEDKLSVIYENSKHTDFVRGLSWCTNELVTCSWDNIILKHNIPTNLQ